MELRLLRYFLAVADEKSFSKAAEKLCIAQPPLSRQIQQLEAEIGVTLIERGSRPLRLTNAGEFFYCHAQKILTQINQVKEMTRHVGNIKKTYTIGVVASVFYGFLPEIIQLFKEKNKNIEIHLVEMPTIEQTLALKQGKIDMGIGRLEVADHNIKSIYLRQEPLVAAIYAFHPLVLNKSKTISMADLVNDTLIVYPSIKRSNFTDRVLDIVNGLQLMPKSILEVRELHIALGMVSSNAGIAIVPECVTNIHLNSVKYLPIQERSAYSPIVVSARRYETSNELDALLACIFTVYDKYNINYHH